MTWYMWLHLAVLVFLVVWACAVIEVPDYDKDGNYVGIKERFRIALVRLFIQRD